MDFWSEAAAQQAAVEVLARAADPANPQPPSHAWLLTGPPGSGRSNLAFRFAAALIARTIEEREAVFQRVRTHSHPDLGVLTTQKVQIDIRAAREVVLTAHFAPAEGRYRVIVIEDADRMPERTSNVLLKALEEPPERTIWVLCAPSEADLLPTIRSRTQSVRLVTPSTQKVAQLLEQRDGVTPAVAAQAARLAQSHVGMARTLALDPAAASRRKELVEIVLRVGTLSEAMAGAARLIELAAEDAETLAAQESESERAEAQRMLGLREGEQVPRQLAAQVRAAESDQKQRLARRQRDAYDRQLTDLLGIGRDLTVLALQDTESCAAPPASLINEEWQKELAGLATQLGKRGALAFVTNVEQARERLHRNVTPQLVFEALLAGLVRSVAGSR